MASDSTMEHLPSVSIRRLWPVDEADFCNHLLRLDAQSRHARFGGGVGDQFIKDYAARAWVLDAVMFGCFIDGEMRAAAELRRIGDGWAEAEAAFSVEKDWQNHGFGDALLRRIIAAAQNRHLSTVYMICLRENDRMRHLAEKHDAHLTFETDSIAGTVSPAWPTPQSILEESYGEAHSFITAVLRWPLLRKAG